MSFSGLKTAILRARDGIVAEQGGLRPQDQSDLSASFQAAISDVLVEKTRRALAIYLAHKPASPTFAIAGGVAANTPIRDGLMQLCAGLETTFVAPPLRLCTDNAAMIAYAGAEKMAAGAIDDLSLSARPRWPLDDRAAPMLGSGKKGAKA